jgi:hypothetical protein
MCPTFGKVRFRLREVIKLGLGLELNSGVNNVCVQNKKGLGLNWSSVRVLRLQG